MNLELIITKHAKKTLEFNKKTFEEYNPRNKARGAYLRKLLTKSFLERIIPHFSANIIAKSLFKVLNIKIFAGTIINICKFYEIKSHSISDSCYLTHVKESKKQTNLNRLGVENPSQSQKIKEKKEKKALEKYGVKNVFQSEEIKKKSKETMIRKYGVEFTIELDSHSKNTGRNSKLQKYVERILTKNNIEFNSEVTKIFKKFNEILNKVYSPIVDILIPSRKIVIEVNGDLWHANPRFYENSDIIIKYRGPKTAEEIWEFDKIRREQIESLGYKVITVWEYDLRHNKQVFEQTLLKEIINYEN